MGADPSSYRDEIPRSSLLSSAARSVCDGWRLGRIEAWLEMAAEEDYGFGGKCRRNWEASGAGVHAARRTNHYLAKPQLDAPLRREPEHSGLSPVLRRAPSTRTIPWSATEPRRKLSG